MTQDNNILLELQELGSTLPLANAQNGYSVPAGYFDGLTSQVLNRIKALEASNAIDELLLLSPLLSDVSKEVPYTVPAGYFAGMENRMMQIVHGSSSVQTAKEELEDISPLLGSLKKELPYQVPTGYFERLDIKIQEEPVEQSTKVVSITSRKWFRYAAAAAIIGVIATAGLLIFKQRNQPSEKEIFAKFTKEVNKLDDTQKDKLADFIDAGLNGNETVKVTPDKPNEVKDLLKGISEDELNDFQEQNEDMKDVLLTTDYNE